MKAAIQRPLGRVSRPTDTTLAEDLDRFARTRAKWCPECSGYGSSLKQEAGRCTRCGGTGLVTVPDAELARAAADGGSHMPPERT